LELWVTPLQFASGKEPLHRQTRRLFHLERLLKPLERPCEPLLSPIYHRDKIQHKRCFDGHPSQGQSCLKILLPLPRHKDLTHRPIQCPARKLRSWLLQPPHVAPYKNLVPVRPQSYRSEEHTSEL